MKDAEAKGALKNSIDAMWNEGTYGLKKKDNWNMWRVACVDRAERKLMQEFHFLSTH